MCVLSKSLGSNIKYSPRHGILLSCFPWRAHTKRNQDALERSRNYGQTENTLKSIQKKNYFQKIIKHNYFYEFLEQVGEGKNFFWCFFSAFVAINAKMRFQTFRKKAGKSV
jgi:hypothetical protein